jgi:SAM-dependent methyltransferase
MAEINRRITGDSSLSPAGYFKQRYCPSPLGSALSLGSGDGQLERQLVQLGVCERIVGIDISVARVERARARLPQELVSKVTYICANLETWRPEERVDLVVAKGILHHLEALEDWCRVFCEMLDDDGLLYIDDFVGATRFQWTYHQLDIVNRVLHVLPDELKIDLTTADGSLKHRVDRPDVERLSRVDPSEAIRSAEIPQVLERYLVPIELRPYGGGLYHQLFSRIMGNFVIRDDLVRLVMELDAILTENGVLGTDYLWGVYRPKAADWWLP